MSQRFATACYTCHRRKTKCDLTLRGSPCSACITNGQSSDDCVPRPDQRYSVLYGFPWCEANYVSNDRFRNRAIISQRHSQPSGESGPASHPQPQAHAGKRFASTDHCASINALAPVAQYYLIHLTSRQEAERRIAQNKFDSCIIILEEMQKVDGYACAHLRVFMDARRSILSNEGPGLAAPMDLAMTHDQDSAFVDWGEFLWKDLDAALAANWDSLSPMAPA